MYKVGDIVRLRTGREPMIVMDAKQNRLFCRYMLPDKLGDIISNVSLCEDYEKSHVTIKLNAICNHSYPAAYRTSNDYIFANVKNLSSSDTLFGNTKTSFWTEFVEHDCWMDLYDDDFSDYTNLIQWFKDKFSEKTTLSFKNFNREVVTFDKTETKTGKENTMSKAGTLYQVIGKEIYGTYLATNSEGKYVLEMKDNSNKLEAYNVKDIEEVIPWTFAVKYTEHKGSVNYSGAKDCVAVGDVLFRVGGQHLGIVTEINTKAKEASPFKGKKLTGLVDFNSDEQSK